MIGFLLGFHQKQSGETFWTQIRVYHKHISENTDETQNGTESKQEGGLTEPSWGLPCREGLNSFTYRNSRITLPAMYMSSRGNLTLTEDRAETGKVIFCFDSAYPNFDVYPGIGLLLFRI